MYQAFYKLKCRPFDITADPSFFVCTKRHSEALSALHYGVLEKKGCVVLTGEAGTGKSLLLQCLLSSLKQRPDIAYAYLFNSRVSSSEFLKYVLRDFGLPESGESQSELLFNFSRFVITRGHDRLYTVLIVDEAHHLSEELLEDIRLLANLETVKEKLLQVVLVGQPELDEKLDSVRLRQLKQRVAVRKRLEVLDRQEIKAYIQRRLSLAGGDTYAGDLFAISAIEPICRYSRGIPRLINSICDNALITAYQRQMYSVTPEVIDDVAADLRLFAPDLSGNQHSSETANVQRAATNLLELYASLQRRALTEPIPRPVAGGRSQKVC